MKTFLFVFTIAASIVAIQSQGCDRKCNGSTRTCTYTLVVDYYYTATDDCGQCFNGVEADCYSPLCIPGDGNPRLAKAVNGTVPGPSLVVCVGDTLVVNVVNMLTPETTSIHWHGIHQVGTPGMDGVPMVTQYPIQPGETYTYNFTASQVGTHFWHSHSGTQRADGVFGPLIVKNNYFDDIPVAYDSDLHTISLLEWFNTTTVDAFFRYFRGKNFYDTLPRTLLVNGHGHDEANTIVPPRRFDVQRGNTYRFRVIHGGNIVCPIEISIDEHRLQLFNMDGNDIVPKTVDSITIANGEKLDFILRADRPVAQYTMRFEGTLSCEVTGYAKLHYNGAPERSVDYVRTRVFTKRVNCVNPDEPGCISYTQLQSYKPVPSALLEAPKFSYLLSFNIYSYLNQRFSGAGEDLWTPFINKIAFTPPKDTLLCNDSQPTCESDSRYGGELTECTHVVTIPSNQLVEFVLVDIGDIDTMSLQLLHPMHLHGYNFAVVGHRKYGEYVDPEVVVNDYLSGALYTNLKRPIIKDTVGVPDGGVTVIRFISDNPGFWLFHCHVDFHTEEGMQLVLRTSELPPKPEFCPRVG